MKYRDERGIGWRRLALGAALSLCLLAIGVRAQEAAAPAKLGPALADRMIVQAIATWIEKEHYSRKVLDDAMSQELFNDYFDRLDPGHEYFLASDIEEFRPYARVLDDMLKRGDVSFPFDIYTRFRQRVAERLEYVKKRVAEPFDFTLDETLAIQQKDLPWPANAAARDEAWRKTIKNRVLFYQLMDEERAAREKNGEKKGEGDSFRSTSTREERVVKFYEQLYKLVHESDNADILEVFTNTLTQLYDPHSTYMNWRTLEDFDISMKLSLQGIGAVLMSSDGYTKVVRLVPGGPAKRDGQLKPGDRIIAVGQGNEETIDVTNAPLTQVVRKIRGEKGTKVNLIVIKTLNSSPKSIVLTRAEIMLTEREASSKVKLWQGPDGASTPLGIVHLPSFYADFEARRRGDPDAKSTTRDVKQLVEEMVAKHRIQGLLMDLRGNGGGSLDEAISVAGLFIPEGPVVQVHYASTVQSRDDEDQGFHFDLPLVVLTDRASASASEIFAAAMKDHDRAVLVGSASTHGKGTVQTILKLDRFPALRQHKPGALKYTMAKFYRINGGSTQMKGVSPHIALPSFYDDMDIGESSQEHALPWDEIQPQKFARNKAAVSRFVEALTARSKTRLANDAGQQQMLKVLEYYKKRRQEKTISLNLEQRRKARETDEEWAERRKQIYGPVLDETEEPDEENAPPNGAVGKVEEIKDPILREGFHIVANLAELASRHTVAKQGKVEGDR